MDAGIVLSRDQSRQVDRKAIEEYGLPGAVLMENVGRGIVDVLLGVDPELLHRGQVAIFCGKGNNAGDGFVIARHLEIRGVSVATILLCPPAELTGDAALNYRVLVRAGSPLVDLSAAQGGTALSELLDRRAGGAAWLVDAMLGTGAVGEPREPFRAAIAWMNAQAGRRLAVDLPSGLDCDTGEAAGVVVRADVTCTMVAAKRGFLNPAAAAWLGELRIVSIGTPPRLTAEIAGID